MSHRTSVVCRLSCALLITLGAGVVCAQNQTTRPADKEGSDRTAVAERMARVAKNSLMQRKLAPVVVRQSAALFDAAAKEDPTNPRWLQLIVEARLQLGTPSDIEIAIAALRTYLGLNRDDRVTQVQLIDLLVSRMQSTDEQLKYLQDKLQTTALSQEVRAHIAASAARIYVERGQFSKADDMIAEALRLNPLCGAAQRMQYQRLVDTGADATAQLTCLLSLIRSNPAQPAVMATLAALLADVGLVDQSANWYVLSFDVSRRIGQGTNEADFTRYVQVLYVSGQLHEADSAADKVLMSNPGNIDASFIKLLIARRENNTEMLEKARADVATALGRRLGELHARLENSEPTTQPIDAAVDNAVADVQKLKDQPGSEFYADYISAVTRLAWFELYFNDAPAPAGKLIDELLALLPEDDITIARLQGWMFLLQGNTDAARVKLSAVADRDPLAALGMIRIMEKSDAIGALQELQKLSANPAGPIGAILVEALRERGAVFMPLASVAGPAKKELDKFPRGWLDILNKPERFYNLTAEPLKVRHPYGDPMLAQVRVTNTSEYDIPVGSDGTIRSDLWFDGQLQGMGQQMFYGAGFQRLNGRLLLHPRDSVSAIVRVDEGGLGAILESNPIQAIPLNFSVLTNPVPSATGVAAPGPCGFRRQFTHVVERAAAPVVDQEFLRNLYLKMTQGTGEEKVNSAELLGTYIQAFSSEKSPEEFRAKVPEFQAAIEKIARDESPSVRAWIAYVLAAVQPDAAKCTLMVETMLVNEDWEQRLLGLMVLPKVPADKRRELALKVAENDAEPIVKQYANCIVELLDAGPTTEPTTQPEGMDGSTSPAPPP